jgi:hypothetical protein
MDYELRLHYPIKGMFLDEKFSATLNQLLRNGTGILCTYGPRQLVLFIYLQVWRPPVLQPKKITYHSLKNNRGKCGCTKTRRRANTWKPFAAAKIIERRGMSAFARIFGPRCVLIFLFTCREDPVRNSKTRLFTNKEVKRKRTYGNKGHKCICVNLLFISRAKLCELNTDGKHNNIQS